MGLGVEVQDNYRFNADGLGLKGLSCVGRVQLDKDTRGSNTP